MPQPRFTMTNTDNRFTEREVRMLNHWFAAELKNADRSAWQPNPLDKETDEQREDRIARRILHDFEHGLPEDGS